MQTAVRLPVVTPQATPPRSIRVSLTDRCDMACVYCRPSRNDGYLERRLDVAEWERLFRGFRDAGIQRVRLTGGEPLLHPRVVELTKLLAELQFEDIALTTNASQLARLAKPLRDAGLHRLNISLDSLKADRFWRLTRGGKLADVLHGIEVARHVGFGPIKFNMVVLAGENDEECEDFVRWAWSHGDIPRFLEVMPIGQGAALAHQLVTAKEIQAKLAHLVERDGTLAPEPARGPARYLTAKNHPGMRVGFISGTSDTFCEGCDRLRITSDGELRSCLASGQGVSTRTSGSVHEQIDAAWQNKPDGLTWKGCTEPSARALSMRKIGG